MLCSRFVRVNDGDDSRHLGDVQQLQFSPLSRPAHIESTQVPHNADSAITCSLQQIVSSSATICHSSRLGKNSRQSRANRLCLLTAQPLPHLLQACKYLFSSTRGEVQSWEFVIVTVDNNLRLV